MVTSRIHFTLAQRGELWERWKRGESISSITRALDRRSHSGVQLILAQHGGIAPAVRRRAARMLKLEEREEISRGLAAGLGIRAIARGLGRSASTICREISRNGGARAYRAARADKRSGSKRCARNDVAWPVMAGYAGG